tara:strand:+ start:92 stop:1003 length:912 start_codon:yes stop_codon:yes gene_type:complete
MGLFSKTITSILPFIPPSWIRPFAMKYVAGEDSSAALETVHKLNEQGFSVTLDLLGEHTESVERSEVVTGIYCNLYDEISTRKLDCNISLKLTHLGLGFNDELAKNNLFEILSKAEEHQNFMRIDMENSPFTDETLELVEMCKSKYQNVGPVLQAYLRRSENDLTQLMMNNLKVRICKGIYRESSEIAFQDRDKIRTNFIRLVQSALSGGANAGIATHDLYLIDTLETWIKNKNITKDRYEFQVLYGVPMKGRVNVLKSEGHKVRIYVPFGDEWYDYSIRRLKENPNIAGYILKNLFTKNDRP